MKLHPVLNFLVFIGFLVMGYTLSLRFYQPGEALVSSSIRAVPLSSVSQMITLDNGQRSLLLAGTSSLGSASPRLESLWMASYLPADSTVQLLPIYPAGKGALSAFEKQLEGSFGLAEQGGRMQLDQEFIDLLEKKNYWWSGYIVFDDVFLAQLIRLLGGVDQDGQALAGTHGLDDIHAVLEQAHGAYPAQAALFQSICRSLAAIRPDSDISALLSLAPSHMLTSLEPAQLQAEFSELSSGGQEPACRFPTLEISRIEP